MAGAAPVSAFDKEIRPSLAWQRAHVDSTEIPVHLISDMGEEWILFDKAKLYALVDDSNSYVYAIWICFNGGAEALALLLRECVRRHGRIPHCIASDQGAENISIFWQTTTAHFAVDSEERPAGASKFGAKVESYFGRIKRFFFRNMPGNTKNDRLGRSSDRRHRGRAHARHTLRSAVKLTHRCVDYLNRRPISGELLSPKQAMREDTLVFGNLGIAVNAASHDFLVHTAIPDGERKYSYTRGISFQGHRYSSTSLHVKYLDGHKLEVRFEPYDPTIIYAAALGAWHVLYSDRHSTVRALTDAERTAELHLMMGTGSLRSHLRRESDKEAAALVAESFSTISTPTTSPHPVVQPERDVFAEMREIQLSLPDD